MLVTASSRAEQPLVARIGIVEAFLDDKVHRRSSVQVFVHVMEVGVDIGVLEGGNKVGI